ncbi:MAG: hypothetical protein HQM10_13405 [Candidatus Riflebacteria bacterium]|nr:hypothetical protein [Candidatus Riflebacteria bacterium]
MRNRKLKLLTILWAVFFAFLLQQCYSQPSEDPGSNSPGSGESLDFMESSREASMAISDIPESQKTVAPKIVKQIIKPSVAKIEAREVDADYGVTVKTSDTVVPVPPKTQTPPTPQSEVSSEVDTAQKPACDAAKNSSLLIKEQVTSGTKPALKPIQTDTPKTAQPDRPIVTIQPDVAISQPGEQSSPGATVATPTTDKSSPGQGVTTQEMPLGDGNSPVR